MNTIEKWFTWWATVGIPWLRSATRRRTAFATEFYRAKIVFGMEKSLGWGTMLKYS